MKLFQRLLFHRLLLHLVNIVSGPVVSPTVMAGVRPDSPKLDATDPETEGNAAVEPKPVAA